MALLRKERTSVFGKKKKDATYNEKCTQIIQLVIRGLWCEQFVFQLRFPYTIFHYTQ